MTKLVREMVDHNIHLGIQIVPLNQNENTYSIIDKAIEVIQKSGLKHIITPMETVIEGSYEKVSNVIFNAQKAILESSCNEFLVNINLNPINNGATLLFH